MGLSHSTLETRDLALFRPLRRKLHSSRIVDLPTLAYIYMGQKIGLGTEDSVSFNFNSSPFCFSHKK
ncbi:hypothetical protein DFH05DRAFT_1465760 [Lentinula detonsa]|uniref:Uncharacterized protein n=1 Tax=Lentinula detonsa TaxID=2804962 RepID=A0A9W8PA25_9AGAR|nr:hypothetical protein DFH05DRAFT_1465760 [Lentinula detonsa]